MTDLITRALEGEIAHLQEILGLLRSGTKVDPADTEEELMKRIAELQDKLERHKERDPPKS